MSVTLADVEACAVGARPSLESYANCGAINQVICTALQQDLDISAEVINGSITKPHVRSHGEEHAFVKIPREDVEDAVCDVIVDGALDQFCDENESDTTFVSLGPKESFESVEIVAKRTSREEFLYAAYSEFLP